ncbi:hypothetical protein D3C71_1283650 [compost metagenome]
MTTRSGAPVSVSSPIACLITLVSLLTSVDGLAAGLAEVATLLVEVLLLVGVTFVPPVEHALKKRTKQNNKVAAIVVLDLRYIGISPSLLY